MSTRAPSGALSLACVVRIPGLVLIEMLPNNQLQHRLVAETALRTLCPERLDECVVQRDRPRARLSMDPPQAARFGDRGAQVRTLEGALLGVSPARRRSRPALFPLGTLHRVSVHCAALAGT